MTTRKTTPAKKAPEKRAAAKKSPASASSQKKTATASKAFEGSVTHLIHRAEQCAGDIFARIAATGAVTPRQFAILKAIEEDPGVSQTGLVDKTGIDRSTLADIVRRMLDKGLVQRERTAEDARAYAVKLTRKGANTLQKMRPSAAEADRQMLASIPKEHRDLFLAILSQMVETLAKRAESAK